MTQQPPVPEANQSPFPIEEAPHEEIALPPVAETEDSSDTESYLPSLGTSALLGIGAVAVGTIATAATLLFARRSKPGKRASRSKAKPKAKSAGRRKKAA